jgi:hypothetical protein
VNFDLEYASSNHEQRRVDHENSVSRGPLFEQFLQRMFRKVRRYVYRVLFRSIPNRAAKDVDLSKLRNKQAHDKER